MNIHIGKAILKQLEQIGMSKSEFGRRINRAPQTVQNIIGKPSIDTNLLVTISKVLNYNFFTLYTSADTHMLGNLSQSKDKITKLTTKNNELVKINELLTKSLKDKDKLISALTKGQESNKEKNNQNKRVSKR